MDVENLTDKTVWLITGAGRGMGVDITGADAAQAAVQSAVGRFGTIDVLVNNAGNFYAGFFEEIGPDDFRAQVDTNLFGPLNVTRLLEDTSTAGRRSRQARGRRETCPPKPTPTASCRWRTQAPRQPSDRSLFGSLIGATARGARRLHVDPGLPRMLKASRQIGTAATGRRRRPGEALRRFLAALDEFVVVEHTVAGRKMSARRPRQLPGAGTCVVLVAGLGLSGRYLLPVAHQLAPRLPVWVPDLPGFGRSDPRNAALDMAGLGDAVVEWMDAAGIASAALVGNSMGCQIAVEAAARHPDRISHVVLEGPTMDMAARSVVRHAGRVATDAFWEPLSLGPLQVFDWLGTGPRRLVATTRYAFAHRVEERAQGVSCPALVVRGSRDPIVPQPWAQQVAAALPSGALTVVRGGSHAMTYSNPVTLADIVEAFIRRGVA